MNLVSSILYLKVYLSFRKCGIYLVFGGKNDISINISSKYFVFQITHSCLQCKNWVKLIGNSNTQKSMYLQWRFLIKIVNDILLHKIVVNYLRILFLYSN